MLTLTPKDHGAWSEVLERSFQHDFYHLPSYHALAEAQGQGQARLFVYTEGEYMVGLPLLLRPISPDLGLDSSGQWQDATSVYGYAGPISSHKELPKSVRSGFRAALSRTMEAQKVVTVFSRLHPLLDQSPWLDGLGHVVPVGLTVSIDLTLPEQEQWAQIRDNHRRGIAKLKSSGVTCLEDIGLRHLEEFVAVYHETMRRVAADSPYFFSAEYLRFMLSELAPAKSHLFVALHEGKVISGALLIACQGILQYHLGGTRDEYLKMAPIKLLFDTVRRWAQTQDLKAFHLGGGVGAQEDSLFHFKAGFSQRRHGYSCWQWIVHPNAHAHLCEAAHRRAIEHGLEPVSSHFFPEYRVPLRPCTAESINKALV